jgi:hypothetical protein
MLPPEFLSEVAVAACKGGLAGMNTSALADLAEMTDLQILEILCKPPADVDLSEAHRLRLATTEPLTAAQRPMNENEEYAQFLNIGQLLMKGGNCKFTIEDMHKYWETRHQRSAAKPSTTR